jgi:hypothetical protein
MSSRGWGGGGGEEQLNIAMGEIKKFKNTEMILPFIFKI